MRTRSSAVLLAGLLLVGCSSPGEGGQLSGGALGPALAVGGSRRVSLPPAQYQRLYFKAMPGDTVQVKILSLGSSAPLSLSIYPVVAGKTAGAYERPTGELSLKPFQKTGIPPLDARTDLPGDWPSSGAVVVELKNIGTVISELDVRLIAP